MLNNSKLFQIYFLNYLFLILIFIVLLCPNSVTIQQIHKNTGTFEISENAENSLNTDKDTRSRSDLVTFTNVTPSTGLSGVSGNFYAWGDYNNDGYQDLLVNGGRLFRNTGVPDYTFTEVTKTVGLPSGGTGNGAWADYDNDGNLDFYSTGIDTLWRNLGAPDYIFDDVTFSAGLTRDDYPTTAIGWGDYDLDGYLDMYIANGEDWNDGNPIYYPDFLYHNNGDGTFTNVTSKSGIRNFGGPYYGRGVTWGDYDDDGWPDIYISNYRISQNWLFHNNRNGTFTDIALAKGVAGEEAQRMGTTYYGHTVGSAWADLDNDGDLDLFESNLAHKDLYRGPICGDSQLYRNDGPNEDYSFTDVREGSGIPEKNLGGGEDELFVGIAIADFNNDGYLDMFIPQIYDLEYSYSYLYHNNGDWTFSNVSEQVGVQVWNTYGGAWCDYDNDGFLDLVTGGKGSADQNATYEVHLYKNNGNTNSWLNLKLIGKHFNKQCIGVRVKVTASNGLVQIREVEGGMGCHSSQNSIPLEFGFGSYSGTVTVDVTWPSGYIQKLENINLNQFMIIEETTQAPDLQFMNVKVLESAPVTGDSVTIEASIVNMGYLTAERASIKFYEGAAGVNVGGVEIGEPQMIFGLEKFHSDKVITYWNTTGFTGLYELWAVIEDVVPGELVITNNAMNCSVNIRPENQAPIARLTVTPKDNIYINDIIHFDGQNSTDDIAVVLYFFDFGDGNNSNWIANSEIFYQYKTAGKFEASLRVKDNEGLISKTQTKITLTIQSPAPPNRAPEVDRFTANPNEVNTLEKVTLKIIAHDPDSDELYYYFSASTGELSSNEHSSSATWLAPDTEGEYAIIAQVFDGEFYSEPVSIDVKVIKETKNHVPVIENIILTPSIIYTGMEVTIVVIATDIDEGHENNLDFQYESTVGDINSQGSSAVWQAPNIADIYFIRIIVTDSGGLATEEEILINVLNREYPPKIPTGFTTPSTIENNKPSSVTFTVKVEDENGLEDIYSVTIDLFKIGGDNDQEMFDNGKNGDNIGNDGYYTYEYLVSRGITPGNHRFTVTVKDVAGLEETYELELIVEKGQTEEKTGAAFTPGFQGYGTVIIIICFVLYLNRGRLKNKKSPVSALG